jgi:hypothetical protein
MSMMIRWVLMSALLCVVWANTHWSVALTLSLISWRGEIDFLCITALAERSYK